MDVMLKFQELRIQEKLDHMDKCNELRVKAQADNFKGALHELKAVAKERHVLFVKDVKTVHEDVNHKVEELWADMEEIKDLTDNYSSLLTKVDIIVEAVTKVVQWYNSMLRRLIKRLM